MKNVYFSKLLVILVLVLAAITLVPQSQEVKAACYDFSYELDYSEDTALDQNVKFRDVITPQCAGGYPSGWSTVKSTSRYIGTSRTGTRMYQKDGGYAKAYSDARLLAPSKTELRRAYDALGNPKWIVTTDKGVVVMYKSTTTKKWTINWKEIEKIRYSY